MGRKCLSRGHRAAGRSHKEIGRRSDRCPGGPGRDVPGRAGHILATATLFTCQRAVGSSRPAMAASTLPLPSREHRILDDPQAVSSPCEAFFSPRENFFARPAGPYRLQGQPARCPAASSPIIAFGGRRVKPTARIPFLQGNREGTNIGNPRPYAVLFRKKGRAEAAETRCRPKGPAG